MTEFAWVIEDANRPGPWYYDGMGWTADHQLAIRYARERDAFNTILGLPNGWHLVGVARQHGWG